MIDLTDDELRILYTAAYRLMESIEEEIKDGITNDEYGGDPVVDLSNTKSALTKINAGIVDRHRATLVLPEGVDWGDILP
jgi:hypothetical protein